MQGIYFNGLFCQLGACFAKASIFLLFFQIFAVQRSIRIAIWIGLTLNFLIYAPGIAVLTYYGAPRVGETWLDTLGDGRNLIPLPWWQAQSALSVAIDIYIFVLPLPTLTRLHLPTRRRISLVAVFSVALMYVTSLASLPSVHRSPSSVLTRGWCRGIAASIASLVQRIRVTYSVDTTWIAASLALCG